MRIIYNFLSIFVFAARRLGYNLGLMTGTALGLIAAVALVMSVPLYADAVNYRLMSRALAEQDQGGKRPPYAFMFRYIGSWHGAVDWADFEKADRFFAEEGPSVLGLPLEFDTRYVKTDNLRLYPSGATSYSDPRQMLDRVAIGFIANLADHVRMVEGRLPAPQSAADPGPIEVIVTEGKAIELGLIVGEEFILLAEEKGTKVEQEKLTVRVVGVWRPTNQDDPFWFYRPTAFDGTFLTHAESFAHRVVPVITKPVYLALWYLVFDGRGVHTEDVPGFMGRASLLSTLADKSLPKTSMDVSPLPALFSYVEATRLLTILLFVFAIPIIGLVLYFVILTTNLVVQRQRNEIAVLRSRGLSAQQVVLIYLLEGAILGSLAITLGPLLAQRIASLMGAARSYLSFVWSSPLVVTVSRQSMRLGIVAIVLALLSTMLPALAAARHTIVTYKQDVARSLDKPWWQRMYFDVLLLVVPLYGYYLLRQRGTISFLGQSVTMAEGDPFSNPLLFLVPTLFVFTLALLFIRFFPLIMAIVARLFEYLPWASPLLALRQLARSSGFFTGPLLLIVLTMGLACFTASMARTLDTALVHQTYYETGADLRLVETGETSEEEGFAGLPGLQPSASGGSERQQRQAVFWTFLPVSEHLKVEGVKGAARIATYPVQIRLGQRQAVGKLVGIDRLDFLKVGFFRRDFAPTSLGALMNNLAMDDSAVLVSRPFLGMFGLGIGDTFTAQIYRYLNTIEIQFVIAGVFDLFPTTYPDEGPILVANLEYIHEQMGGTFPYDVLLSTASGSDTNRIREDLEDLGLRIVSVRDSRRIIEEEKERPERQGILGLLSIGTMAAAFLTVLGLLFYSFVSLRRRFIELGILRAIGLGVSQMIVALGFEQLALIVTGVAAGTGFGVWASRLFIPFLQVRGGPHAQIPPFVVQIAWGDIIKIYIVFGLMLLITVVGLVLLLLRMRIAEAVKLGESV